MRYSKLVGKTQKEAPSDATTKSHKLLYKGGYIRESTAGRYYFLPLGMRVQQKIMKVIKEEMDAAGAQELVTPILHPLELWQETNRTNTTGFELMTVKDRRGAMFALGGTAEEMMVDLVRKFQISYKELPFNIYQFSNKFRDELRARGGLLRVREFIMKDAYSFDANEEEFKKEYKNMWDTYKRIFDRMGLKTIVVEADNGYIGGDYCHEFVVEADIGESKFYVAEDRSYAAHEDVARFKRENINIEDPLKELEIIEQPQWVKTMEDDVKHYNLPKSRFLKNVVYKNRTNGEIVIAVIRGDLNVNQKKLEHVLKAVGQLEDATDEDLLNIGTKPGYVHSWGHKGVRYIGDTSLTTVHNFIGGQKEDTTDSINVNYGRDFKCEILEDIALAEEGHLTESGNSALTAKRGIEVGNIFQLGYHYTNLMDKATYTNKEGTQDKYYMGCYGIGVGRTMATIAEVYNDDKGLKWPEPIAPFKAHLLGINMEDENVRKSAEDIYQKLLENKIDVLFDDRDDVSAGEKFSDADLIGIPYRLVVSKKTNGGVEIRKRGNEKTAVITLDEMIKGLKDNTN